MSLFNHEKPWSLGAIERIVYEALKSNPRLYVKEIAERNNITEVEVTVALQLLKYKNMI